MKNIKESKTELFNIIRKNGIKMLVCAIIMVNSFMPFYNKKTHAQEYKAELSTVDFEEMRETADEVKAEMEHVHDENCKHEQEVVLEEAQKNVKIQYGDERESLYLTGFNPYNEVYKFGGEFFTDPSKGTVANGEGAWSRFTNINPTNEKYLSYTEDVLRVFNRVSEEHIFTSKKSEYESLTKRDGKTYKEGHIPEYVKFQTIKKDYVDSKNEQLITQKGKKYNKETKKIENVVYSLIKADYTFKDTDVTMRAVYRLYNRNAKNGDHHYTSSFGEINKLVKRGWELDNTTYNEEDETYFAKPLFYVFDKTVTQEMLEEYGIADELEPMYMLYNKNNGRHLMTSSKGEYDKLGKIRGWKQEDIKFYIPHTHNYNILEVNKNTIDMNVKEIYNHFNDIQACYIRQTISDQHFDGSKLFNNTGNYYDKDYNLAWRYFDVVETNEGTKCSCGAERMLYCYTDEHGNIPRLYGKQTFKQFKSGEIVTSKDDTGASCWRNDNVNNKQLDDGKDVINNFKKNIRKGISAEELEKNAELYFMEKNTGKTTFEKILGDTGDYNETYAVNYRDDKLKNKLKYKNLFIPSYVTYDEEVPPTDKVYTPNGTVLLPKNGTYKNR